MVKNSDGENWATVAQTPTFSSDSSIPGLSPIHFSFSLLRDFSDCAILGELYNLS